MSKGTELGMSLLSCPLLKIPEAMEALVKSPCSVVHVDIMDQHCVPNLSFGMDVIVQLQHAYPQCVFDIHLMVMRPDISLEALPASIRLRKVYVHAKGWERWAEKVCRLTEERGGTVGVVIDLDESLEMVEPCRQALKTETFLVMSVQAGFGGQAFQASALAKVEALRKKHPDAWIALDGGVAEQTWPLIAPTHPDHIVVGSALWRAPTQIQQSLQDWSQRLALAK